MTGARDYGLDIGGNIKRRRLELGLSLQDVATAVGISKAHVWDLERANSDNPSICVLVGLADALRLTLAQVLGADISQPRLSHEELELIQQHRRIFGGEVRPALCADPGALLCKQSTAEKPMKQTVWGVQP